VTRVTHVTHLRSAHQRAHVQIVPARVHIAVFRGKVVLPARLPYRQRVHVGPQRNHRNVGGGVVLGPGRRVNVRNDAGLPPNASRNICNIREGFEIRDDELRSLKLLVRQLGVLVEVAPVLHEGGELANYTLRNGRGGCGGVESGARLEVHLLRPRFRFGGNNEFVVGLSGEGGLWGGFLTLRRAKRGAFLAKHERARRAKRIE